MISSAVVRLKERGRPGLLEVSLMEGREVYELFELLASAVENVSSSTLESFVDVEGERSKDENWQVNVSMVDRETHYQLTSHQESKSTLSS